MSLVCRSCGSGPLRPILSLGHTPFANALLTAERLGVPEPTYAWPPAAERVISPRDLVLPTCPDLGSNLGN